MLKRIALAVMLIAYLAGFTASSQASEQPAVPTHEQAVTATGHGGESAPSLLPDPLSRDTWLQVLWVVIIFVVLLAVLYPTAWKSILTGLKAREERIRRDIADAEETRNKAEATLREYSAKLAAAEDQVRQLISDAARQGEQIAAKIRDQAQRDAEESKSRATRDIEAAKKQALTEIYAQTADLATRVAEKILRRNLTAVDQQDLVQQSLGELENLPR